MTDAHDEKAREIVKAIDREAMRGGPGFDPQLLIATALRDCERQTIERAAKVADGVMRDFARIGNYEAEAVTAGNIAQAIRALGTNDTTGGE
jgi:hypothetical protein